MAMWTIEQKVEVWYYTEVEATNFQDAIEKANESSDWQRHDDTFWTEEYWGENQDTEEQFTSYSGNTMKEGEHNG